MSENTFIFGLGNPGDKYQHTRHNAGFLFAEHLRRKLDLPPFSLNKKLEAEISKEQNLILAKPMTYMNESGRGVRKTLEYFSENIELTPARKMRNLYVVHDDLDLELGTYKIQLGTGPQQHNGLNSIYQYIKVKKFWHVRIGVDDRGGDRTIPAENYVLQKLPRTQRSRLVFIYNQIIQQLEIKEKIS